jgi:hypothetical protein
MVVFAGRISGKKKKTLSPAGTPSRKVEMVVLEFVADPIRMYAILGPTWNFGESWQSIEAIRY